MNLEMVILWLFLLANIFSAAHIAYFSIRHERDLLERVFNFIVVLGLLYYSMTTVGLLIEFKPPGSYSWVIPMGCFHIVNFLYLSLRMKYLKINSKEIQNEPTSSNDVH